MQRYMTVLVAAVVVAVVTSVAVADNQKTAEGIASSLRESGKLSNYKIGVKYQEGTTWLTGRVRDQQQMTTALKLVLQMPGVTRVINNLNVQAGEEPTASEPAPKPIAAKSDTTVRIGQVSQTPAPLQRSAIMQPESMRTTMKPSSAADRLQQTRRQAARPEQTKTPRQQVRNMRGASNQLYEAQRVPTTFVAAPARRTAAQQAQPHPQMRRPQTPRPMTPAMVARAQRTNHQANAGNDPAYAAPGGPRPMFTPATGGGAAPVRYDQPHMPNHAWPSYAAYPNYAAVTYPRQYSPTAWPYIGPFYPYPQVPLGWRKVTLEWDDGWWMLDFKDR